MKRVYNRKDINFLRKYGILTGRGLRPGRRRARKFLRKQGGSVKLLVFAVNASGREGTRALLRKAANQAPEDRPLFRSRLNWDLLLRLLYRKGADKAVFEVVGLAPPVFVEGGTPALNWLPGQRVEVSVQFLYCEHLSTSRAKKERLLLDLEGWVSARLRKCNDWFPSRDRDWDGLWKQWLESVQTGTPVAEANRSFEKMMYSPAKRLQD